MDFHERERMNDRGDFESKLEQLNWQDLPFGREEIAIVLVDHGSRRAESNALLLEVVVQYRTHTPFTIVEPAHMELAEPSIEQAFGRCAEQGAKLVVVHPYFLLPGRHWDQDIPHLSFAAAEKFGLSHLVTSPLGLHPLMTQVVQARIEQCLKHAAGLSESCDLCADTKKCQFQSPSSSVHPAGES